jgi:hypothetical protein
MEGHAGSHATNASIRNDVARLSHLQLHENNHTGVPHNRLIQAPQLALETSFGLRNPITIQTGQPSSRLSQSLRDRGQRRASLAAGVNLCQGRSAWKAASGWFPESSAACATNDDATGGCSNAHAAGDPYIIMNHCQRPALLARVSGYV